MKYHIALGVAVAAALTVGTATANAAPTGPSSVDRTVNDLKAQGYNVIVNRVGGAQSEDCAVQRVRAGQRHETRDSRGGGSINTTVISETVYVDVAC
ncbi:hypothetical protein H7J87_27435 [Mycolicibacterium wolinskyi]|uniref:PASTA domain-containing protein n=1 Tax=Mycolicibacterium wolinskyi TaxID=59750 RepID=A0A1X2F4D8_9MYCO|nr:MULTISPECIES: hypothetical protein [Mycolicibacterium]MCV7289066.1 hypothetical protein [Mycolicibacterium wolinskyi]MCV7296493.1 hypothetical protein [Mycolicibacterium goodii]ORX13300.1 hypothetical protein AWC31_01880 [Mycolicibacterium wolinskyi]